MRNHHRLSVILASLLALAFATASYAETHTVGCYIDTSAWQQPTAGGCFLVGSTPSSADFYVMSLSSTIGYQITWSSGNCGNSLWCVVPISPGQTVSNTATIKNLITGQTTQASASASYIQSPF